MTWPQANVDNFNLEESTFLIYPVCSHCEHITVFNPSAKTPNNLTTLVTEYRSNGLETGFLRKETIYNWLVIKWWSK
jgi:hypothetical protein